MSPNDRQLARLLRAEEPPEPPPELLESLRRDIPHLPTSPRLPRPVVEELHPRPFLGWMAAAASLVIALGGGMLALRIAQQAPPAGDAAAVAPAPAGVERVEGRDAVSPVEAAPPDTVAAPGPRPGAEAPTAAAAPQPLGAVARMEPALGSEGMAGGAQGVEREPSPSIEEDVSVAAESPPVDAQRRWSQPVTLEQEVAAAPEPVAAGDEAKAVLADRVESGVGRLGERRSAPPPAAAAPSAPRARQAPATEAPATEAPATEAAESAPAIGKAVTDSIASASAPRGVASARPDEPRGAILFEGRGANPFVDTDDERLSGFGLAAGAGSYEVLRGYLAAERLPPPDAVRVEELVNAFRPRAAGPVAGDFALAADGVPSPWAPGERYHLLRLVVRARGDRATGGRAAAVATGARVEVEFDPRHVARWRLLGYEGTEVVGDRGEGSGAGATIEPGQTVTAVYEVKLHEDAPASSDAAASSARLAELRLRWRRAGSGEPGEAARVVRARDLAASWDAASRDLRVVAVAARFGEILRQSYWVHGDDLGELARRAQRLAAESGGDPQVEELAGMIARARDLRR
jgi:hypothetical protein